MSELTLPIYISYHSPSLLQILLLIFKKIILLNWYRVLLAAQTQSDPISTSPGGIHYHTHYSRFRHFAHSYFLNIKKQPEPSQKLYLLLHLLEVSVVITLSPVRFAKMSPSQWGFPQPVFHLKTNLLTPIPRFSMTLM